MNNLGLVGGRPSSVRKHLTLIFLVNIENVLGHVGENLEALVHDHGECLLSQDRLVILVLGVRKALHPLRLIRL